MKFYDYENENGGTMRVAEVEEDGTVSTYGGQLLNVKAGDKVAQTSRPDEYYVVPNLDGWSKKDDEVAEETVSESDEDSDSDVYDPADHNAADVIAELDKARADGDEERFADIKSAEASGKDRAAIRNTTF